MKVAPPLETYRAAVKRWLRDKITLRNRGAGARAVEAYPSDLRST